MNDAPPDGFEPVFRTSPFMDTVGPLYSKGTGGGLVLGMRVAEKHINARGLLHGGVVATLADITLGYGMASSTSPPQSLVTTSLTVDFAGTARVGDWIEMSLDIQKVGRRMAFANTYCHCNGERIARGSGVFLVV
jgi:acyl-coenzyme A thioesterase 13